MSDIAANSAVERSATAVPMSGIDPLPLQPRVPEKRTRTVKWSVLFLLVIAGFAAMLALDWAERTTTQRQGEQRLERAAANVAALLSDELHNARAVLQGLVAFMLSGDRLPSYAQFDRYAAAVLASDPTIRGMAYVDTRRIIRHFYPLSGNEAAIGLDLMKRPAAPYVERAISKRHATVGKPVTTVQGSFSTIIRAPLYREDRLLGVVQALIEVVPLVRTGASALGADMAYMVLDDEGTPFLGTKQLSGQTVESSIDTGDRHWTLRVGWQSGAPPPRSFVLALIWGGGGLFLVSLLYIVKRAFEQHQWLEGMLAQRTAGLVQSEKQLRTVMETLPLGVWVTDKDGNILSGNPAGRKIWGGARYVGVEEYGEYKGWWHDTGEKIAPHEWALARAITKGETSINEVVDIESFDGERKTILNSAVPLHDSDGKIAGAIVVNQDITAHKRSEEQARQLSRAIEQTADAVIITDRNGVIGYVNDAFETMTGFSREHAIGQRPSIVKSGMHDQVFYQRLWTTILGGKTFRDTFINRKRDGELYYEEKTITPIVSDRGEILSFVSTGKNITDRMQTQERLHFLAHHDALTKLPNRILFMDRLTQALARAHWHQRVVAVMFLDLDRFKNVNDSLGHNAGDQLLQKIGARLNDSVREGDTVARLGGDEFAIVLEDVAQPDDVSLVAGKILHAFAQPYHIDGRELFITSSIGVSVYPNDGDEAAVLLKNADAAMYGAKEMGKNNYQFYSADMSAVNFERLTMETHLRHALERNEFELFYQPQVDLRSGEVMGMEALIRWRHPEFGLLSPVQFIGLAEETGMIGPIGEWVARTACAQLIVWQKAGYNGMRMAINVSGRQFNDAAFIDSVSQLLSDSGLTPSSLELEITESVVMKNAAVTIEKLRKLHAMGVRFAIDDFGTGYSSLGYLRRFAVNTLKIDKSFTMDILDDEGDAEIVRAIIAMAHSLKLQIIAEGVENQDTLDFLRRHKCDAIQGYFFSRPLPAPDITRLLKSGKSL